jgi:nitroreductase
MTSLADSTIVQALRRAAVRATLAPSVHNTQPWRFVLGQDTLEIRSDASRRLAVLDPTGRQMMISCGCALFNARVALEAAGYRPVIERFPDPLHTEIVARVTVADGRSPDQPAAGARSGAVTSESNGDSAIGGLNAVIDLRRTNRRRFAEDIVPDEFVADLVAAAQREGSQLTPITRPEQRISVAVLSQRADAEQNADPAYRAELRSWSTDDPMRVDGVPATVVPRGGGGAQDEVPIRDFDTDGAGALPNETHSGSDQCLLLLGSPGDGPADWLRAGEALEHVWLEITRHGFAMSPLTQVIEVAATRALLRHELALSMQPHVLLRVGRAANTPATRRRRLVDVLEATG